MNTPVNLQIHRRKVRAAMVLILIGMMGLVPALGSAAQPTPPTVGNILVTNYDCGSGVLDFRVPVTDLRNVPSGTSASDYPLAYSWTARYAQGPDLSSAQPSILSPTEAEAPYSGNIPLRFTIPTTNDEGPVTSVVIRVSVGYGGAGLGASENPTGTSTLTFLVPCDAGNGAGDDLVGQLIEVLKRILSENLSVG